MNKIAVTGLTLLVVGAAAISVSASNVDGASLANKLSSETMNSIEVSAVSASKPKDFFPERCIFTYCF